MRMDVYYNDFRYNNSTGFCVYNCTKSKFEELCGLQENGVIYITSVKTHK